MALADIHLAQAERLLRPFIVRCEQAGVGDQVRVGYRIERSSVVLFESRIHWKNRTDWLEHRVAKFQFVATINRWRLFCQFSDLEWRGYAPLPEAETLAELVREVDADPTGIFWG
jgi:hypothetical protein